MNSSCINNAFRAPGAPTIEALNSRMKKVEYLKSIYSNMRREIYAIPEKLDDQNIDLLRDLSFAFVSIDRNSSRGKIIAFLLDHKIPFIDVGLGVEIVDDSLAAILRMTHGTSAKNDHLFSRISTIDTKEDKYSTNIQIADLNCMNAVMAVIKWKKFYGFYKDLKHEHHSTFTVNTSQFLNDDFTI